MITQTYVWSRGCLNRLNFNSLDIVQTINIEWHKKSPTSLTERGFFLISKPSLFAILQPSIEEH